MKIQINPERLLKIPVTVVAILAVLYIGTRFIILRWVEDPVVITALRLFDMDDEVSIPTWFSQTLLFSAGVVALVLGFITKQLKERWHRHWWIVAGLLIYMSLDEGSGVHENSAAPHATARRRRGYLAALCVGSRWRSGRIISRCCVIPILVELAEQNADSLGASCSHLCRWRLGF